MIGNKIKFRKITWIGAEYHVSEIIGIVVDAYTEVRGRYKSSTFIGIGEGKGDTNSSRMYKVECISVGGTYKYYEDIYAKSLIEILEYNNQSVQHEKFVNK